ncbi:far upstream element-binding protein 1 isoform X2 [Homalodisca vitripennis]|nr:far upstream element-binding protein 1 isoform X2 [Homalodisca vitripennis]
MSDYSAVAPPQNFSQSSAFAAALQRAKQIAAKINPSLSSETGNKRPLEDNSDGPDAKKVASDSASGRGSSAAAAAAAQAAAVAARVAAAAAAGIQGLGVPGLALGPVTSEDIRVPDKMVGLIIGRGGEQISRLQSESGCKIQMAPDSGGQPERVCTLTGNAQSISRAKELISAIVQQRSRTEGTGGARLDDMNMGGTPPNVPHMGDRSNEDGPPNKQPFQFGKTQVEIMVPGPKVGLIIGKGGETIKQLQEKSGAKMVVIQDGPSQENEKPLRITGDPQKVEHAKALVYELIAEKEMQNAFNRGGGNGGGANRGNFGNDFNGGGGGPGSGGGDSVEVAVPRAAVGVVIGKGGDMIKKIQGETGARVQFQQGRDDGPGDRRCLLTGKPEQVEEARQRIEELIDSVLRRDSESGRGGGRGGNRPGGGGPGGFDRMGGGGGPRDFNDRGPGGGRGWDNNGRMGGPGGDKTESTFTVPAAKCGVIIGRGGETIKLINQQTGAHCELDRRPPANPAEKTFVIRGAPDQIENAKRLIAEKLGMPGPGPGNAGPPQQFGMGGPGGPQQHFGAQNWQQPGGFQQPWQNPQPHPQDPSQGGNPVQVNPQTGQPDYSAQWVEYYRSLGMHREAELIEQQAKANKGMGPQAPGGGTGAVQPQATQPQPVAQAATQNGQPDYSAQWAEYYRSIGKIKEAEAIEASMKSKQQGAGTVAAAGGAGPQPGGPQQAAGNPYPQAQYGYQAGAFYGGAPGAPQPTPQPGAPQYAQYPNYAAYAGQPDN